ncbi:bifunctional glycosyltransferase/CDP-glycerol:glycerophosphate glycerophosphotransferase [Nocardioides sp. SYSU DS0651]|uniref:bifunctional glycosyltransferase/CDP-glycerol:glycerophosphate glycerophosphotransferase n=1 Tax=Nocardioides sp. SYSU DS0651 TaxID=3415955 RepID=UPI003F4B7AB8
MQFSLVIAAHNVGRYLPELIDSVESQTIGRDRFEVVVVDDGSTDETPELLERWARTSSGAVTVLTQDNRGQAAARNAGLEVARGEWIGFPDADDVLRTSYLDRVARFLDDAPDADMVATKRVLLDDATGEVSDTHPLTYLFRHGDVLRNLTIDPSFFHGSAPAAFYRRAQLDEVGLRFSEAVRPNFEDGHFSSHYLLQFPEPKVGFVASAVYLYRKGRESGSTLQTGLYDERRYTDVLRFGYLELLRAAVQTRGTVPQWLQNFVIYELSHYLSAYEWSNGAARAPDSRLGEFHALMREVLGHIAPGTIAASDYPRLTLEWRLLMMHGYRNSDWVEEQVVVREFDRPRRLMRLSYYFTGPEPAELFESQGRFVDPSYAKTRVIVSHEKPLLKERVIWLPVGKPVRVFIDGHPRPVVMQRAEPPRHAVGGAQLRRLVPGRDEVVNRPYEPLTDYQIQLLAESTSRRVRGRFAKAWVMIDRLHDADDSAEHLFQWLRANRPEVNAWFVVEEETPSWRRLKRSPYRSRLVAYGTREWELLMLNAEHLVSSHADEPIVRPAALSFVPAPWRFTFLQHGVIKDDLSRWLNGKPISTFVTSTFGEHESIAGPRNAYRYSPKEVVLAGLPRFDLLRERGLRVPREKRDLLLVAPTWRVWLVKRLAAGSQRREAAGREVLDSDFVQQWLAYLHDPDLASAAHERRLTVGFLPHPNLRDVLDAADLPSWVKLFKFDDNDPRELVARSALVVTDYSSMAFNAAYIDRPVVYFQFDSDMVLGGGHVGRRGYFDYRRDGFGPVAESLADAIRVTREALAHGPAPAATFQERIDATFPLRDGRCRERVADAIAASTAPGRP